LYISFSSNVALYVESVFAVFNMVVHAMHSVVVVVDAFISQILREQFGHVFEAVPCPSARA